MRATVVVTVTEPEGLPGELWLTVVSDEPPPDFPTIRELAVSTSGRADISRRVLACPTSTFPPPGQPWEETWVVARETTAPSRGKA